MKLKYFTTLVFMISIFKITAQSGYSLELNVKTIPTEQITKNETGIGFSFYNNVDTKNKITNSISYKNTGLNYNLNNYYSANDNSTYNRIENNFELVHKTNKKINWEIEFRTVAAFEESLGFSDINFLGGAGIQYWLNKQNNIHLGVKRMTVFGKAQVLPSISIFSQINTNTSIEVGFPNSSISYSNNDRNNFRLTNAFEGEFYQLDKAKTISPNLSASKMSFSQMTTTLEYERNIDQNWFINFQGGYQFNKKYTLTDNRGTTQFNFDANDGYLFNIGIKYKQ